MNEVSIHGEEQEVAKFVDECFTKVDTGGHCYQQVLDFDRVLPEPDYNKPQNVDKDLTTASVTTALLSQGGIGNDWQPDWYTWRLANWGTKWNLVPAKGGDVDGYTIDIMKDTVLLSFATAWSPPDGIYDAIGDKYPDLDVSWFYREDGMQMSGWLPYE
jgi:hypothetical protein